VGDLKKIFTDGSLKFPLRVGDFDGFDISDLEILQKNIR